jgi:NAD kinase
MLKLTDNKIIVVTRRTRLDDVIVRFNTLDQAKFYVEHLGADFSDYIEEDRIYKRAISTVGQELKKFGRVQMLERTYLSNFIFGKEDVVVVVGQDGLVANTLKYLNSQPIIAINPDPNRWDGVLLPFKVNEMNSVMSDLLRAKRNIKEITFAKVETNNGQCMYGVNDLFIGPKTHVSARYIIEVDDKREEQSSSGIIISTGLGSTGWLSSILAGAKGVVGQEQDPLQRYKGFDWAANYLYYSVREPFPSKVTGTNLIFGKIVKDNQVTLTSMMAQHGVIFSDGLEADFIEFNSGTMATISVAEKKGYLVV